MVSMSCESSTSKGPCTLSYLATTSKLAFENCDIGSLWILGLKLRSYLYGRGIPDVPKRTACFGCTKHSFGLSEIPELEIDRAYRVSGKTSPTAEDKNCTK